MSIHSICIMSFNGQYAIVYFVFQVSDMIALVSESYYSYREQEPEAYFCVILS